MRSFSTRNGDVVVNKTIELVSNEEVLRQKVQRILGTNLGEWGYDPDEGIDFSVLLTKNPNEESVVATIEQALLRIDETFSITSFEMNVVGRAAEIKFTAVNADGTEVGGDYTYGD